MTEQLIDKLNAYGFCAEFFETPEQAVKKIASELTKSESVGFGGSVTVAEIGLKEYLLENGYNAVVPTQSVTRDMLRAKERTLDAYVLSANAVTENGELINLDGTGNRIAAAAYGPKKVFYVLGVNKITKDLAEGIDRVKNVAAPLNAKRLNRKTPCVVTGKCENCSSPERICRAWLINTRPLNQKVTYVYIINKDLGL